MKKNGIIEMQGMRFNDVAIEKVIEIQDNGDNYISAINKAIQYLLGKGSDDCEDDPEESKFILRIVKNLNWVRDAFVDLMVEEKGGER